MAKILVIDDSMLMRRKINQLLTQIGHEVVGEASNGSDGFKKYEELKPEIVTMDIKMPNVTGLDAIDMIITKYPNANIIVISVLNEKKMIFDALEKGAKHYIFKPISKDSLSSVINQVLSFKK